MGTAAPVSPRNWESAERRWVVAVNGSRESGEGGEEILWSGVRVGVHENRVESGGEVIDGREFEGHLGMAIHIYKMDILKGRGRDKHSQTRNINARCNRVSLHREKKRKEEKREHEDIQLHPEIRPAPYMIPDRDVQLLVCGVGGRSGDLAFGFGLGFGVFVCGGRGLIGFCGLGGKWGGGCHGGYAMRKMFEDVSCMNYWMWGR